MVGGEIIWAYEPPAKPMARMPYLNMECLAEWRKPLGALYSLKPKCLTMRYALTFLFKKGCCDTIFGISYHWAFVPKPLPARKIRALGAFPNALLVGVPSL